MSLPVEEQPLSTLCPGLNVHQPLTVSQSSVSLPESTVLSVPQPSFRLLTPSCSGRVSVGPYVKYKEPSETDLGERVEYDMDEQDKCWLAYLNEHRNLEGIGEISEELFEIMMDRLEKQWFDLTKQVSKAKVEDPFEYPEDSTCSICNDGECENSNAIVFCDGCNLPVHQDCYGIPFIPEGQWLCRKCMISPDKPVTCVFCPSQTGAFKQTTSNKWCHSVCALWIPEVEVTNHVYMEPIDGVDRVPKSRWKLTCYICKRKHGASIQCSAKNCFTAFHPTCAQQANLFMKIKGPQKGEEHVSMKAFCDKHTPKESRDALYITQQVTHLQHLYETGQETIADQSRHPQQPQTKQKRDIFSHPVAPHYIHQQVLKDTSKFKCMKKSNVLSQISKYWALKREFRQGAPLLKRLHLEPWTASASMHQEEEKKRAKKFKTLMVLRKDLERIRLITEMARKREREKLKRVHVIQRYMEYCLYPIKKILLKALDEIKRLDSKKIFAFPVDTTLVPDYLTYIHQPMDFLTMETKIHDYSYPDLDSFEMDVKLICKNARTYNAPDTIYYRAADRLETNMVPVMERARLAVQQQPIDSETFILSMPFDHGIFDYGKSEESVEKIEPSPSLPPRKRSKVIDSSPENSDTEKQVRSRGSSVNSVISRKKSNRASIPPDTEEPLSRLKRSQRLPKVRARALDQNRVLLTMVNDS